MPDMTLDKIRDAIAAKLGWRPLIYRGDPLPGWWKHEPSGDERHEHPVPPSLDLVAENWPSNYYIAVRTAPGIDGWEASAMPHDEFEFHVVRTGPTELHARMALLLAVLEAEGKTP